MMTTGRQFPGVKITDYQVLLVMPFGLLAEWLPDPNPDPRRGRKRGQEPVVSARQSRVAEMHALVQRNFVGAKRTNMPSYREYITALIDDRYYGDLPEVVLWIDEKITVAEDGKGNVTVTIPQDPAVVAIDGETQIAARFDLLPSGKGSQYPIVVRLHHAIDYMDAAQVFSDRNTRGIAVPRALALSRDYRDIVMESVRELAKPYPETFTSSGDVRKISLQTLRDAVIWSMMRKLKEPRRRTEDFAGKLETAQRHLHQRLGELSPLLSVPTVRRPPVFIATTDASVDVGHLKRVDWTADDWTVVRLATNAKSVQWLIDKFHRDPLPFPGLGSDQQRREPNDDALTH